MSISPLVRLSGAVLAAFLGCGQWVPPVGGGSSTTVTEASLRSKESDASCPAEAGLGRERVYSAERACEAGSISCCVIAANAYQLGRFGLVDAVRARALLEAACDGGEPGACAALSTSTGKRDEGAGSSKAQALGRRAAELYERSCEEGNASDCEAYADLIQVGVLSRYPGADAAALRKRGRLLREQACRAGSAQDCRQLALRSFEQRGKARSVDRPLLEKACTLGDATACLLYGHEMLADPTGQLNAITFLLRACGLDNDRGCDSAAQRYLTGQGVPKDLARAIDLYDRSCALGSASGCIGLARAYREPGPTTDLERAADVIALTCRAGVLEACAER